MALCQVVSLRHQGTGTVAYEIAIKPFYRHDLGYATTVPCYILWLCIVSPQSINRIGNILTPALALFCVIRLLLHRLGHMRLPGPAYATNGAANFPDGYITMDALASVVFAILVIDFGPSYRCYAMILLPLWWRLVLAITRRVYIFIANIGASGVNGGLFDTIGGARRRKR